MKALPEKQLTWMNPHWAKFKVAINTLSTASTFPSYCVLSQSSHRGIVDPSSLNENMNVVRSLSSTLNGSLNSSAAQVAALATNQYSVQMSSP